MEQDQLVPLGPQQAGPFDRVERLVIGIQTRGGVPDDPRSSGVVGGHHQQVPLRRFVEPLDAVQETAFHPAGHRKRHR